MNRPGFGLKVGCGKPVFARYLYVMFAGDSGGMGWVPAVLSVSMLSVSGLALFFGIRMIVNGRAFEARAVRVPGVVVGNREKQAPSTETNEWIYHPIVRYVTREGAHMEETSHAGRSRYRLEEGTQVIVMYEPDRPARCAVEELHKVNMVGAVGAVVVGAFFLPFGLAWLGLVLVGP